MGLLISIDIRHERFANESAVLLGVLWLSDGCAISIQLGLQSIQLQSIQLQSIQLQAYTLYNVIQWNNCNERLQ